MAGETILIVDDDEDIREIISIYLENEGYKVVTAVDGIQGIEYALNCNPDLIILDMMLPGLDGIEICQELRKKISTPIIFLSCKSTPGDKSIGLIAGGDDYMSKPFDTLELIARVKAHIRRNRILENYNKINSKIISYPDLIIDLKSYSIRANGKEINLPPKEFQLLTLLAESPDKVFSTEEIYHDLWDTDGLGDYRTVMVHISKLRKKIERDPKNPIYIQTVKGVGYKFSIT